MTENSEGRDEAKIVEIAHAMLDGALGIIEGSRRINDLRAALGIDHLDEDFVKPLQPDERARAGRPVWFGTVVSAARG